MKSFSVVGCLILLFTLGAKDGEFSTAKARSASAHYTADLKAAKERYLTALKQAQDVAFKAKDREEINRIQAEMDHLREDAQAERPLEPFVGKSYLSTKTGPIMFRKDGAYLGTDVPEGAKWYRVDDHRVLVWTASGWASLFVFNQDHSTLEAFNVGQLNKQASWTASIKPERK